MQDKLEKYVELLKFWNSRINLVQQKTLSNVWDRHINDSMQLSKYISNEVMIVDLGSGAGFPGIVLSILGYNNLILTEINKKKFTFLREVKRILDLNCEISFGDVNQLNVPRGTFSKIVATARGFSSLKSIFSVMSKLEIRDAVLNKGEKYKEELNDASSNYDFNCEVFSSETSENGVILKIENMRTKQ